MRKGVPFHARHTGVSNVATIGVEDAAATSETKLSWSSDNESRSMDSVVVAPAHTKAISAPSATRTAASTSSVGVRSGWHVGWFGQPSHAYNIRVTIFGWLGEPSHPYHMSDGMHAYHTSKGGHDGHMGACF